MIEVCSDFKPSNTNCGQSDSFRYPDPKQIKLDQANSRLFLPKTTTTISQNHAMVCIEDLQVRNMSKSAAGSTEKPGRNVRANSGLNKSILDQGWFECVECGFEENADVVGAINVLRAGHARLACEVSGAVMPPAAGTHRSDSGVAQCRA